MPSLHFDYKPVLIKVMAAFVHVVSVVGGYFMLHIETSESIDLPPFDVAVITIAVVVLNHIVGMTLKRIQRNHSRRHSRRQFSSFTRRTISDHQRGIRLVKIVTINVFFTWVLVVLIFVIIKINITDSHFLSVAYGTPFAQ